MHARPEQATNPFFSYVESSFLLYLRPSYLSSPHPRLPLPASVVSSAHSTPGGYRERDFLEAWQRYLPPLPPVFRGVPEQNQAPEQEIVNNHVDCAAVPE